MSKPIAYSEIFHSIQGEGNYTGVPSTWLRFFLCNLQCDGFGQDDPTNPDSYDLPYLNIDVKDITSIEDLPVWEKGCDSSYSWSKKFKHLQHKHTAIDIANLLTDANKNEYNPTGLWTHPVSGQTTHLCVTGGEPLMKHAQKAFVDIWNDRFRGNSIGWKPMDVTWETNGTQELTDEFFNFIGNPGCFTARPFISCSPKLFTVSGEKPEKAIKPEIVKQYRELSSKGQLKFVVGHKEREWEEMEQAIAKFKDAGVDWPIWVMPTGAREEEQSATAGKVAEEAFKRGYNVAARVHVYLFGNAIGT